MVVFHQAKFFFDFKSAILQSIGLTSTVFVIGIIVFSVRDHHSWKIYHPQSMKADPTASTFRVGPTIIQAPINLASIALSPRVSNVNGRIIIKEDRQLYYCPLSSLHLYSLRISVLRNEENGLKNGEYQGEVEDMGIKGSQSVGKWFYFTNGLYLF